MPSPEITDSNSLIKPDEYIAVLRLHPISPPPALPAPACRASVLRRRSGVRIALSTCRSVQMYISPFHHTDRRTSHHLYITTDSRPSCNKPLESLSNQCGNGSPVLRRHHTQLVMQFIRYQAMQLRRLFFGYLLHESCCPIFSLTSGPGLHSHWVILSISSLMASISCWAVLSRLSSTDLPSIAVIG